MYITSTSFEPADFSVKHDAKSDNWPIDIRNNGRLFMSLTIAEAKQLRDGLSVALANIVEQPA